MPLARHGSELSAADVERFAGENGDISAGTHWAAEIV